MGAAVEEEVDGRLNLGGHRPLAELPLGQVALGLLDGQLAQVDLLGGAVVEADGIDRGADGEVVNAQLVGQQRGGEVLVDDRLDADVLGALATHRDAAATAGHDDAAGIDQ